MPLDDPAPFGDVGAHIRAALAAYLPPSAITVAEHAEQHRWFDTVTSGPHGGRWNPETAPYLRDPQLALTAREHTTVAIAGPGRCGKTVVGENWLLHSVDVDPAPMLWYEPTDDAIESYVKRTINPLIETHEPLRRRLGSMPIDRSLHFKRFGPMVVEFLAAGYQNLISKTAARIVLDEYDACPESDGDVYRLADVRRQTFDRDSMILAISHPDRAAGVDPLLWNKGIMGLYAQSDRRTWWWPCPHCNGYSSPNPTAGRVMRLNFPGDAPLDEIPEATRLECPLCGTLIEDRWRRAMNLEGRWVAAGEEIDEAGSVAGVRLKRDIAGFWIVGVMSPFILGGIGALARDLVGAEREDEASGDYKAVPGVMAKRWGIPAKPRKAIGSVDAATLAERADDFRLGQVPAGVRFLTAAIDVQAARFEVLVRGWGERAESWIVDHRRVTADTAVSPTAWDELLHGLLAETWPLADGSGRGMALRAIGYDSGGAPGVTQQAYDVWKRLKLKRVARFLGRIDGREVHSVLPMKGRGGPNTPRLQVLHPMSKRTDRKAVAAGDMPRLDFGTDAFKDDLAGQLAVMQPGAWMVHIPAAMRGNYPAQPNNPTPPHAMLEQLVAEVRKPNGTWEKSRPGVRNEFLDLMVMSHALAELHGLRSIKWDMPPHWAAEWAMNTAVIGRRNTPPESVFTGAPQRPTSAVAPREPAFRPVGFNPAGRRAGPTRLA